MSMMFPGTPPSSSRIRVRPSSSNHVPVSTSSASSTAGSSTAAASMTASMDRSASPVRIAAVRARASRSGVRVGPAALKVVTSPVRR